MSEEVTHQFPKNGFTLILTRLDSIDSRLSAVEVRLTAVEERVDRRLMETRPIWEEVWQRFDRIDVRFDKVETIFQERFERVEARLDRVESRLDGVESRLVKVERAVYLFGKKFRDFHQDLLDVQNAQEDLEERFAENHPTT
jgi:hypothetical protein